MQEETSLYFVSRRFIIRLRWLALFGQIVTVSILHAMGFVMPIMPMAWILGITLCVNLFFQVFKQRGIFLNEMNFPYLLLYDLIQLGFILFFTGGLLNPFVLFIVGPIFIISSFNNTRLLATTLITSCLLVSFLYISPYPLPWFDRGILFDPLIRFATAISLLGSILFYGSYLFYIHRHRQNLLDTLNEAERTLLDQKKITELGLMAAGCAHELGTPLGTILVAANDIVRGESGQIISDAKLIVSQTKRCQRILKQLSSVYKKASQFAVPLEDFLMSCLKHYPNPHPVKVNNRLKSDYDIQGCPELLLAFGNIFQNAIRHAKSIITIVLTHKGEAIELKIHNDGEEFDENLLRYAGEIMATSQQKNIGIGLFIAKRLFQSKGISLKFKNEDGAACYVLIPLSQLTRVGDFYDKAHASSR